MENKEMYQKKMQAKIDEWKARIDELRAQSDQTKARTKQEYLDEVEKLKEKKEDAQNKLDALKAKSGDAWGDLKEGVDRAYSDMKHTFENISSRFS